MNADEYSSHRCDVPNCNTELAMKNGDWFCPSCNEEFQLVPESDGDEFIV